MKSNDEFYRILAEFESSGNKNLGKNKYKGYLGKYQIGEAALKDAGYYEEGRGADYYDNTWTGKFTGKNGINSVKDFVDNVEAQDRIIQEYMALQWQYTQEVHDKIGTVIGDIILTPAALIAGAHLVGAGRMMEYVKSGGKGEIPCDGNGTPVTKYMRAMWDCDVSAETNNYPFDYESARNTQKFLDYYNGHVEEFDDWMGEMINPIMWKQFSEDVLPQYGLKEKVTGPSSACSGVVKVNGYTTEDGKQVDGYTRRCWLHGHR